MKYLIKISIQSVKKGMSVEGSGRRVRGGGRELEGSNGGSEGNRIPRIGIWRVIVKRMWQSDTCYDGNPGHRLDAAAV